MHCIYFTVFYVWHNSKETDLQPIHCAIMAKKNGLEILKCLICEQGVSPHEENKVCYF